MKRTIWAGLVAAAVAGVAWGYDPEVHTYGTVSDGMVPVFHGADGKGIRSSGSTNVLGYYTNILAAIGNAQAMGSNAAASAATVSGRVDTVETDLGTVSGRVDTVETDLGTVSGRVDTVETDLGTVSGRVDTVETDLGTVSGRVDTVETDLGTVSGRVDTVETDLGTVSGRVDTVETDLGTVSGRVDTVETDLGTVSGRVDTVETDLGTVSGRVDTVETDLGTVSGRVDTAESNITNLDAQVEALENQTGSVRDAIVAVSGRVDNALSGVVTVSGRVDTAESDVTNLEAQVGRLQAFTGGVWGSFYTLSGRVDAAFGAVGVVSGRVDALETNVGSFGDRLLTLEENTNTWNGYYALASNAQSTATNAWGMSSNALGTATGAWGMASNAAGTATGAWGMASNAQAGVDGLTGRVAAVEEFTNAAAQWPAVSDQYPKTNEVPQWCPAGTAQSPLTGTVDGAGYGMTNLGDILLAESGRFGTEATNSTVYFGYAGVGYGPVVTAVKQGYLLLQPGTGWYVGLGDVEEPWKFWDNGSVDGRDNTASNIVFGLNVTGSATLNLGAGSTWARGWTNYVAAEDMWLPMSNAAAVQLICNQSARCGWPVVYAGTGTLAQGWVAIPDNYTGSTFAVAAHVGSADAVTTNTITMCFQAVCSVSNGVGYGTPACVTVLNNPTGSVYSAAVALTPSGTAVAGRRLDWQAYRMSTNVEASTFFYGAQFSGGQQ